MWISRFLHAVSGARTSRFQTRFFAVSDAHDLAVSDARIGPDAASLLVLVNRNTRARLLTGLTVFNASGARGTPSGFPHACGAAPPPPEKVARCAGFSFCLAFSLAVRFAALQVRVSPYCMVPSRGHGRASPYKGSLCSNPHPFGARLWLRSACGFRVGPCTPPLFAMEPSSTDTHPKGRSKQNRSVTEKRTGRVGISWQHILTTEEK